MCGMGESEENLDPATCTCVSRGGYEDSQRARETAPLPSCPVPANFSLATLTGGPPGAMSFELIQIDTVVKTTTDVHTTPVDAVKMNIYTLLYKK